MATFKLADLNLTVNISADAARWVDQTRVDLRTYAHDQAVRRLNGLPLDKGVSVVLDCEDDRYLKAAATLIERAAAKAAESVAADTYATKKTDKLPERAADTFEPPTVHPIAGDIVVCETGIRYTVMNVNDMHCYTQVELRAEHGKDWTTDWLSRGWRILRRTGEPRHPSAGQATAVKARVFAYQRNQWVGVIIGSECYGKWPDLVWARTSTPIEVGAYIEITSTPEADAIITDLCAHVPAAAAILNAKG